MKFSTTTSSILCATMALSPSLAAAVPAGTETPTSPNPGSANARQFPSSPVFDGEHSPLMSRSPALRTGHGSPRRSIPSRLLKVHQRAASTSDASLLDGLDPLLEPVGSIAKPITKSLQAVTGPVVGIVGGLPGIGGTVQKAATELGLAGAQKHARSVTPSQSPGDLTSAGDDTTDSEPETSSEKPSGGDASKTSDDGSSSSYHVGLGIQAEIIGTVPGALVIEFPSGEVDTVAYGKTDSDEGQYGSTKSGPDSPASDSPPSSPASPDYKGSDQHSAALLAVHPTSSKVAEARVNARSSTPSQSPEDLTPAGDDKAHSESETSPEKSSDGDAAESSDDASSSSSSSPSFTGLGIQAEIIGSLPDALVIEFPSGEVDTVAYGMTGNGDDGQDGPTESGPDSPAPDAPPSSPTSPGHTGSDLDSAALLAVHPTPSASPSAALHTPPPISSTIAHALAAVFSSLPGSNAFSHPSAPSQPASQSPSHSSIPQASSQHLATPSHPSDTAASVAAVSPLPSHSQSVNPNARPSPEAAVLPSGHPSVPTTEDITVAGSVDGSPEEKLAGQS